MDLYELFNNLIYKRSAVVSCNNTGDIACPVYVPWDVKDILTKPYDELLDILNVRDNYYRAICHQAVDITASLHSLQIEINKKNVEIESLKEKKRYLNSQLDMMKREAIVDHQEMCRIQRLIKKINPALIAEHFDTISKHKPRKIDCKRMVEQSFSETIGQSNENQNVDNIMIDINVLCDYDSSDKNENACDSQREKDCSQPD